MGFFRAETWTVQANRSHKHAKLKRKEAIRRYKDLKRKRRKRWGSPV